MKHFVVYFESGRVVRFGTCQDETFELQASNPGELVAKGEFNGSQYVANGVLVDMPARPSVDYVFDYDTKDWVFDTVGATAKAYERRNQLLKDGPDRISQMWWSSMTPEQQQAWSQYRQNLLDVPQQPGFPADIIWPVAPGA